MTAVKTSGLGDRLFVGGYDLGGDTQSFGRIGGGPAPLVMTDITQSGFARQGGILGGEINWVSYLDKQANQAHAILSPLPRTSAIVTYAHQPAAIGSAMASMYAKQIGYDPTRGNDGMLTIAVATQNAEGYPLEWGQALTVGKRNDTTATNGTALDGGASTAFGAQAYLHVFGVTGTSVTVKLQDSADNSSFSDIASGAFTAATGVGAQRIALPAGATVRRYVRAVTSGTFTSATFAVNFVRNEVAVAF
jgi:hypothetical protein